MPQEKQMTVGRIAEEPDRTLLFESAQPPLSDEDRAWEYRVIAGRRAAVTPGDIIAYEPYGANFGWLSRVVGRVIDAEKPLD